MHINKRRDAAVYSRIKQPKRRNTRYLREPGAKGDHGAFTPTKISPGSPFFRYFTHFVKFFRGANEKTPEEKAAEKVKILNLGKPCARGDHRAPTPTKISPDGMGCFQRALVPLTPRHRTHLVFIGFLLFTPSKRRRKTTASNQELRRSTHPQPVPSAA